MEIFSLILRVAVLILIVCLIFNIFAYRLYSEYLGTIYHEFHNYKLEKACRYSLIVSGVIMTAVLIAIFFGEKLGVV